MAHALMRNATYFSQKLWGSHCATGLLAGRSAEGGGAFRTWTGQEARPTV
jgi:hypothetical protein